MPSELPLRCARCFSRSGRHPVVGCQVCRDQAMSESFLCEIVRRAAGTDELTCAAFRPHLTIVGKNSPVVDLDVCQDKDRYFEDVVARINSGRCGGKGCARPGCNGTGMLVARARFHVVWVVRHRQPVFADSGRFVPFLHDAFLSCARLMAGRVLLLWLAADHLHLYVETSPKEQVLEILDDLQGLIQDAVEEQWEEVRRCFTGKRMWEREFFLERIDPA
ncbi:MAG: transposase [Thermodesulfobacteriota bacterium]